MRRYPPGADRAADRRQVMSTGASITLIAVGAVLRFALAAGSPHGPNVQVVGVILILAGVIGLLLSLLAGAGPLQSRRLAGWNRTSGNYDLAAGNSRLARRKRGPPKTSRLFRRTTGSLNRNSQSGLTQESRKGVI